MIEKRMRNGPDFNRAYAWAVLVASSVMSVVTFVMGYYGFGLVFLAIAFLAGSWGLRGRGSPGHGEG